MNETHTLKTSYISIQTWKTRKHKQLCACGKSQNSLLTLSCTWHRNSSTILHQWTFSLWGRETSDTHRRTRSEQSRTLTVRAPHVLPRSSQSSVNVRPWERGFILECYGIFTPLVTASFLHTHTHLGFPTLPTQCKSLCIMHNTILTCIY